MTEQTLLTAREDVTCSTAGEFIDTLRLTHSLWMGRPSGKWAFRGQANASWGLVPKSFRETTNLAYTGTPVRPPLPPEQQRRHELKALNHFLFLADRVGLPIPGDSQQLRLPDTVQHDPPSFTNWPWETVLETLAIAQHHGIPTRLLDFSHNPLIAAFFAARSVALAHENDFSSSMKLAVWAVNLTVVSACVEKHRSRRERPTVIWVTASRAGNTFLREQDALFLLDLDADGRSYPPDLQNAILDAPNRAGLGLPSEPLMIRILLPISEARSVLRLLWNEAYHPAKLMPTYDNVAATLEYRRELGV